MFIYLIIFVLSVLAYIFMRKKTDYDLSKEHCLLTGGSSGIGLELAIQCAKLGASVTIIARSRVRLDAAKEKILSSSNCDAKKIQMFSADISKQDIDLKVIVADAENLNGPITMLFNCAGKAIARSFEDTSLEDFNEMLSLNYVGSVRMTQAVLPSMKKQGRGKIMFTSSLAGIIGLYGYTAYSGSKFAIVGLAEALQMEVKIDNINVTVSFPPDTDTPGFAEENKGKPLETLKISESGGLYPAKTVALKTLHDTLNNKFMSSVGFEGWMLCTLGSFSTPGNSLFQLFIQATTIGFLRIAIYIYLAQCDHTIKKINTERKKAQLIEK